MGRCTESSHAALAQSLARKRRLAAAADAAHVRGTRVRHLLQHVDVPRVAVRRHHHVVRAAYANAHARKVAQVAAEHALRRGKVRRHGHARAVVCHHHAKPHVRKDARQRAAHVAAAKHVAHGVRARGLHVRAGRLVPRGRLAGKGARLRRARGKRRRVQKIHDHARGVAPVLAQHKALARLEPAQQVLKERRPLRLPRGHAHQGVAAACHAGLRVRHPLQARQRAAGKHVVAALLHLLLYPAAAHGAEPRAVPQERHPRRRVARHGAAGGKHRCQRKRAPGGKLGQKPAHKRLVAQGVVRVLHVLLLWGARARAGRRRWVCRPGPLSRKPVREVQQRLQHAAADRARLV